jgi:hypothetical protein
VLGEQLRANPLGGAPHLAGLSPRRRGSCRSCPCVRAWACGSE